MLEPNPFAWFVTVNGIPVDARTLPDEIQAEARRLGLIPDLDRRKGSVSGTVSSGELDALINELTVDCYNDEEQLVGLLTGAEDALAVGEIATVAGAEIRIVSVDCPSDSRRGLTAMCEREGQRFELSLADIRFGDASELGRVAAAYRRWLGCDPHPAPGGAGHRQVGHP